MQLAEQCASFAQRGITKTAKGSHIACRACQERSATHLVWPLVKNVPRGNTRIVRTRRVVSHVMPVNTNTRLVRRAVYIAGLVQCRQSQDRRIVICVQLADIERRLHGRDVIQ